MSNIVNNIIKVKDLYFEYGSYNEFEAPETSEKASEASKTPPTSEVKTPVLSGINLEVPEGQFLAVLGRNGSGKSTLAKLFNGILAPVKGSVIVNNIDASDDETLQKLRQTVGMVFQNPDNQIVATIVEEDVAFALENLGVAPPEIRERIDEALKTVNMSDFAKHAPHQLSGGQKQRVAIAGVIAMAPKCIVLDEPTAMLDPSGRREVMETVKKLNKGGSTIIYITHYMEEAAQADRIIVMDDGKIIMDGAPREIFKQADELKAAGLDVPQVTELARELRESGLNLPEDVIFEEECAEAILKLFQN